MVERSLMVRWVIGSILHGGLIVLFLVPTSAPRLVYILILSDGMVHTKDPLLPIGEPVFGLVVGMPEPSVVMGMLIVLAPPPQKKKKKIKIKKIKIK